MNTLSQNEIATAAVEMSPVLVQTQIELNHTLETTELNPTKVKGSMSFYAAHYANPELDSYGVAGIISEVLTENQAIFPRNIEKTELRPIAVAAGMFTADIIAACVEKFKVRKLRYKPQAVKNQLSTYNGGMFGKIKLTNDEDKPRPCSKPRAKWYLVDVKK